MLDHPIHPLSNNPVAISRKHTVRTNPPFVSDTDGDMMMMMAVITMMMMLRMLMLMMMMLVMAVMIL